MVYGRIRADLHFDEVIEASSSDEAVDRIEARVCARCGVASSDIQDEEIYAEVIGEG